MYVKVNLPPISKRQLHTLRRALGKDAENYEIVRNVQDCEITTSVPNGGAARRGVAVLGQLGKALGNAGVNLPYIKMVVLPDDHNPKEK